MISLAAFGLTDSIRTLDGAVSDDISSFLSDVVLPSGSAEKVLVGNDAEKSRLHSGYEWPPESRIPSSSDQVLRRLPVPLLWNLVSDLSKDNEPRIRWRLEKGGDISTASLLAKHCAKLLKGVSENSAKTDTCICIPSKMLESAQDYLLNELRREGFPKTRLLWRDIAAILAAIKQGIFSGSSPEVFPLSVLVVYAGVDQLEVSLRRVCRETIGAKTFLVPERFANADSSCPSLFSLIASSVGSLIDMESLTNNSRWKLITSSEKFWKVLLNQSNRECDLIHKEHWRTVTVERRKVDEVLFKALNGDILGENWLEDLLCKSASNSDFTKKNFDFDSFRSAIASLPKRPIDKVILSGALLQNPGVYSFLKNEIGSFTDADSFVITESGLCEGANEYLRRIRADEPTYYDYLQPLSLLVADGVHLKWLDIISQDETRVIGGKEIKRIIPNQIAIEQNKDKLEISLRIDSGHSRLIRAGRDVVEEYIFHDSHANIPEHTSCYIRCLARKTLQINEYDKKWLSKDSARILYNELLESELDQPSEWKNITCRTLPFDLPQEASERVACDLIVEASPASGRARLTIKTVNSEFASHREFTADYSQMEQHSLADLINNKKIETGWPQLLETPVYPMDYIIPTDDKVKLESFLNCSPDNEDKYLDTLKLVSSFLLKGKGWHQDLGKRIAVYNENGVCSGIGVTRCVAEVQQKLTSDFHYFNDNETRRKILTQASYLFSECPDKVKKFALNNITEFSMQHYNFLFSASCRVATKQEEIGLVVNALFNWAQHNESKSKSPISYQGILGMLFLLRFRKVTEEVISPKMALTLSEWLADAVDEQIKKKNVKSKFYQAVLALLYMLRVRRVSPTFLSPGSSETTRFEEKLQKIANDGIQHAQDSRIEKKIRDAVNTISGYINYRPDHSIITSFIEQADEEDV